MQVCLDFQPAVAQRAGIGRYTRRLAEHLAPLCGADDRLKLFYMDFRRSGEAPRVDATQVRTFRAIPGAVVQQGWKHLGWPPFDLLAGSADLYHFPNFIMPPLRRGRAVVTIHDMSFERFPECSEARNLAYLRGSIRETVRRADAILTISKFSADEITALLPGATGKVHAIPLGIDKAFRRPDNVSVFATLRRLGLARPYLLCVGTVEPRKNLKLVIEAFDALDAFDGDLVLSGMPGWRCEPIFEAMRGARRADRIRYLRYVADADLPGLYAGAELFVVPSLYEGFGFPPLEAMACGTPVVSSTGGALPEVLGDAAHFVDGFACGDWVEALRLMLNDAARREALRAAGALRAHGYRWEDTARHTWRVYREVNGC